MLLKHRNGEQAGLASFEVFADLNYIFSAV